MTKKVSSFEFRVSSLADEPQVGNIGTVTNPQPETRDSKPETGNTRPRVSIIVAMARNRIIGKDNALPWHLPADLKHFKQLTMGHPIIMGRKTYESIGKPLPGRNNIIVSRAQGLVIPGCLVFNSPQAALAACYDKNEVFIIGGAELFSQMLSQAQRIYITEIHADFEGDTWFPVLNQTQWREVGREHGTDNGLNYDFVTLDRVLQ